MVRFVRFCAVLSLLSSPGIVQAADSPMQVGDSASISLPIVNGSTTPMEGVRMEILAAPTWLDAQPTSLLGPINVYPGSTFTFRADFVIDSNYNPNDSTVELDLHIWIATGTGRMGHFRWHVTSLDALRTSGMVCYEDSGDLCGHWFEPDTTHPVTDIRYIWAKYTDEAGKTFIAGHTLIALDAMDPAVENSTTSGVAFVGYAIDAATDPWSAFEAVPTLFAIPDEGSHVLSFASRDEAGNVEPPHELTLIVDDSPPASWLEVLGASRTAESGTYIVELTSLAIHAVDPGTFPSGWMGSTYLVDATPESCGWQGVPVIYSTMPAGSCWNPVYSGPFTLPVGTHTVRFAATDQVGNQESIQVSSITVEPLGASAMGRFVWLPMRQGWVLKVDRTRNQAVDAIRLGNTPSDLALDSSYAWVATPFLDCNNQSPGNMGVVRVDRLTGETVRVGDGWGSRAVAVDDTSVWTADYCGRTVTRLDKGTGATTHISLPSNPLNIAVGPDYVWVGSSNYGSIVQRIDRRTNARTQFSFPYGYQVVKAESGYVWLLRGGNFMTIYKISDSGQVAASAQLDPSESVAYSFAVDESRVWAGYWKTDGSSYVVALDKTTLAQVAKIQLEGNNYISRTPAITVDDRYVWAAVDEGVGIPSRLVRIEKATLAVTKLDLDSNPITGDFKVWSDGTGYGYDRYFAGEGVAEEVAQSADGVATLVSRSPGVSVTAVSSATASSAFAAAVSGQGLVPVHPYFYELGPTGITFDPPATLSFRFDPGGIDTGTVAMYVYDGVTWSSSAILSQRLAAVTKDLAFLAGRLSRTALYAGFFRAPTGGKNWVGLAGDGNWHNAPNWAPYGVPGPTDDVFIDFIEDVVVDGTSGPLSFGSLTLGGGGKSNKLKLSGIALDNGNQPLGGTVTVRTGGTLEQSGLAQLALAGSLIVERGGRLTHSANGTAFANKLSFKVGEDFDLQSGSTVDIRGLGYASGADSYNRGSGPGAGSFGAGGGHGGAGGSARWSAGDYTSRGGGAYEDILQPAMPGSGGGGTGGVGGGVAVILAAGSARIDGTVLADGFPGAGGGYYCCGGGGAGGGIRIAAGTIAGSGSLSARGGDGYAVSYGPSAGAGGAGGRVLVGGAGSKAAAIRYDLEPGAPGHEYAQRGGAGTLALLEPGQEPDIIVSAEQYYTEHFHAVTPISRALAADRFALKNAVVESTSSAQPLTILGSMALQGKYGLTVSTLTFPTTGMASFTIPVGSTISVTAMSHDPAWPWVIDGSLSVYARLDAADIMLRGSMTATDVGAAGDFAMGPAGFLSHPYRFLGGLRLEVGGDLSIAQGAAIGLTDRGYSSTIHTPGSGPGGSRYGHPSGGAGHGGFGGTGRDGGMQSVGGPAYGSLEDPVQPGSGSGWDGAPGAPGGGLLVAVVSGTLTLDGTVSADGGPGGWGVGGGSGGSVNLRAGAFAGNGSIASRGGDAGGYGSGGGSGGRIAVRGSGADGVAWTVDAAGGKGGVAGSTYDAGQQGGGGTVFLYDPTQARSALQVGGPAAVPSLDRGVTPIEIPLSLRRLKIADAYVRAGQTVRQPISVETLPEFQGKSALVAGSMTFPVAGLTSFSVPQGVRLDLASLPSHPGMDWSVSGQLLVQERLEGRNLALTGFMSAGELDFANDIHLLAGSTMTHSTGSLGGLSVSVGGDFNLDAGAAVYLVGRGYDSGSWPNGFMGQGPGGGRVNPSDSSSGGGGGHGGRGGSYLGGGVYGDMRNPSELGSGGGGMGGTGGGKFVLNAAGDVLLNGLVDASGAGGGYYGAGGSGGAINLCSLKRLSGSGSITADGGIGASRSGGGGGGRICAPVGMTAGLFSASGGAGGTGAGEAGTIFRTSTTAESADLVVALTSFVPDIAVVEVATTAPQAEPFTVASSSQFLVSMTPFYELGQDHIIFGEPASLRFLFQAVDPDTTTLAIFRFDGVKWDSGPIANQQMTMLADNWIELTGTLQSASLYGVLYKKPDTVGPATTLVVTGARYLDEAGKLFTASSALYGFWAVDSAAAGEKVSEVDFTEYRLDAGQGFSRFTAPFNLEAGPHTIEFRSQDKVANVEAVHSSEVFVDASPPAAVGDLYAQAISTSDIVLSWTAPPEEGAGLARYDVRLSTEALDEGGFAAAQGVTGVPAPLAAGAPQSFIVSGVRPGTEFNIALKSVDHVENASALSNVVSARSWYLLASTFIVRGEPELSFVCSQPAALAYVATTTPLGLETAQSAWNAGFVTTGRLYDLGPDGTAFSPPALLTFRYSADEVRRVGMAEGELALFVYDHEAGLRKVPNQTLDTAAQSITASLAQVASVYGIFGPIPDRLPPRTAMRIGEPMFASSQTHITSATELTLGATDDLLLVGDGAGLGVDRIEYSVDEGTFTRYLAPVKLSSAGPHTVTFFATDVLGQAETPQSRLLFVDDAAPVSSLSIGEPRFRAFGLDFVTPQTPIALSVIDDPLSDGTAAGAQGISYRIDGGAELPYTASFPLSQGTHTVEFWSYDRVGNVEYRQSRLLTSTLLQTAALTAVEGITGSGTTQISGGLLSNGKVTLSGNVRVVGDVTGSPVIKSGKASITGAVSQTGAGAAVEPIDLALVEQLASAASSNALIPASFIKDGALVLTGNNTLTLATGTYVLKSLNLSGNAVVEAAGPVNLFVDGAIQISGNGKLNAGGTASSFVVFSKAASPVTLSGGAQVLGLVYAPKAPVELAGSARIGGSLYSKAAVFSGTARMAAGEALPPESLASGGGGGRTADADADAGTVPGDSRIMAAADPAFVLRDLYAFPNPAVGGAKPVIHAAVGIADRVLVKIFDVSGRQTQEATLDGSPQIVDDGSGPKYAYEYTWDGHIPSGVYFYTIEAEKSGQKIRKAGKLSVVR